MRKIALNILASYFFLMGLYIFLMPQIFYDLTPGLSAMGAFNLHFIRDVSFAFLVSGSALLYGVRAGKKDILIIGSAWPFLHSLFHIYIWMHRGFPFDFIWVSDFVGVILPGVIAIILAIREPFKSNRNDMASK